jgi:RNA polymerase sigma-70 factor, ECF subfamily
VRGSNWDWEQARRRCLRETRSVLREPADAEEAAQEALLRAWRSRRTCAGSPLPWIGQIARNEAFRLRERRQRLSLREIPDGDVLARSASPVPVESALDALSFDQLVSGLRADDRRLIELRYVDDLSQPEVAKRLRMPEGTVKVRLHRLRKRLRQVVGEQLEATG